MLHEMRERQPWSTKELPLLAAPLLVLLLSFGSIYGHLHTAEPGEVDVVIDTAPYVTSQDAEHAALQRLDQEVQRASRISLYRINLMGTGIVKVGWLCYLPSQEMLSMRVETNSSIHDVPTWDWSKVDDSIIAKAAHESGGLQSLARYGCKKTKEKDPTEQEMRDSGLQMSKLD